MPISPSHHKIHLLISPGFLLALGLLLANDHLLKALWPGWFTGKLSDFSGLFCFPLFFVALFPKYRKPIYVITALGFLYWKLPLSNHLIEFIGTQLHLEIQRALDYSDWIAILILPFSYRYSFRKVAEPAPFHRAVYWTSGLIAVVAFVATSPLKHRLTGSPYPPVSALGFHHCQSPDSLVYRLCSKKTDMMIEVPLLVNDSAYGQWPVHFSFVDSNRNALSDIRPNYARVFHPYGIVFSTDYSPTSHENSYGLLDYQGKKILDERYRILESLQEHPDLSIFRRFKTDLDSLERLASPSQTMLFQCKTADSLYLYNADLTRVSKLVETYVQVLSENALLVSRRGTREPIENPIGVRKHDFLMSDELDFPGIRYSIIGLDAHYLVPPIIEAAFYSGDDLWTLVCGTDLLLFDAKNQKVVRKVVRKFPAGIFVNQREIPSRATLYKGEWSLVDRRSSRTFKFSATDTLDNNLVALQFMLKLWNADEQRDSYAWVCFDFNGMPIGVRQQYVAVELGND